MFPETLPLLVIATNFPVEAHRIWTVLIGEVVDESFGAFSTMSCPPGAPAPCAYPSPSPRGEIEPAVAAKSLVAAVGAAAESQKWSVRALNSATADKRGCIFGDWSQTRRVYGDWTRVVGKNSFLCMDVGISPAYIFSTSRKLLFAINSIIVVHRFQKDME